MGGSGTHGFDPTDTLVRKLEGLTEKITELSTQKCLVVGVVSDRPELEGKSEIAAALASLAEPLETPARV